MSSRRSGTVIELLGAPAAGKSGLAGALAAVDGVAVVKDHAVGDLPALLWSAARSLPVALARPPETDLLRWAAWAGRLSASRRIARRRLASGSSMVVFDQGPAYTLSRMAALRDHPGSKEWWCDRCQETARLLDLVVLVDADSDVLVRRLRHRDKVHQAGVLPEAELRDYLASERRANHEVADQLAREGAAILRVVTSDASLDEQRALVLSALPRRLARSA